MKKKITIKQAKELCSYGVGYYKIQHLLHGKIPIAYVASKTYGWYSDIYDLGGIKISTGYVPIGQPVDDAILQKYDGLAKIVVDAAPTYEAMRANLDKLISEFVEEI